MTEKQFKCTNISANGMTGLFWLGKDQISVYDVLKILNDLSEENEQLKQRNDNQYNQLDQLWELIQAKDWETLTAMDNEMKENDERLKREWKCYE